MAKILVVDDEPDIRRAFRRNLEIDAVRVIEAGNGPDAIRQVAVERPDIVVTDIRMAGSNGLETDHARNTAELAKEIQDPAACGPTLTAVLGNRALWHLLCSYSDMVTMTPLPEIATLRATTASPPLRVLIVDDDDAFRNALRELLESSGHKVTSAASGAKALELYGQQKNEIDVVLLDYYMPELDGAQTFEWMRRMKPTIKVIVVSGADGPQLQQLHSKHAIKGYLRKPLLIPELEYVMRKLAESPAED